MRSIILRRAPCQAMAWPCCPGCRSAVLRAQEEEAGFVRLDNGTDLTGWAGRPQHWSVEDGAITGRTTTEHPAQGNNFLFWTNGIVKDFELRASFKITSQNADHFANSGVQYRSKDFGNFVAGGYQADMEVGTSYTGILYEERMRGILATRGEMVWIQPDGKKRVVGAMGSSGDILKAIKDNDWNEYTIIARGHHLTHIINHRVTVDVTDDQTGKFAAEGILALQLHAGGPMTVQFKNIRLRVLEPTSDGCSDSHETNHFPGRGAAGGRRFAFRPRGGQENRAGGRPPQSRTRRA